MNGRTPPNPSEANSTANRLAVERIVAAKPVLVGCERASGALGLGEGELGHAGPPFSDYDEIPPAVLNALTGAALHERWADTREKARSMIERGEIRLRSNHDLGTVSPMAGVVRPSQTVMRIEDRNADGVTHATLAEAGRLVLRFGFYDDNVATGLDYLDRVVGPSIEKALPAGGLEVLPCVANGVALGDDVHQRNVGGMFDFVRQLPGLDNMVRAWLLDNPQHFLNYAMASAKLALDRARDIPGSSIVTAISRNGSVCGVRLAGTGSQWFTAPATTPDGEFFAPHTRSDAHADLGDSAIMEAYGLGGAIAHCAPELARRMHQDWSSASEAGVRMRALFETSHPAIAPALAGGKGIGLGLDAYKVVTADEPVRIHTGIAHRNGATGWIGIGVARAPVACFESAIKALDTP
ncbi:DUF1116 domain-containing protein [Pararobbsia alpina]|uniref:oxamate carbamoyltransferase subunit AllG family protein n=1 Tax=Pararobbsia alpina TaxID=621374 RepID=UPI0039A59568